jgi:hypothetical protein
MAVGAAHRYRKSLPATELTEIHCDGLVRIVETEALQIFLVRGGRLPLEKGRRPNVVDV